MNLPINMSGTGAVSDNADSTCNGIEPWWGFDNSFYVGSPSENQVIFGNSSGYSYLSYYDTQLGVNIGSIAYGLAVGRESGADLYEWTPYIEGGSGNDVITGGSESNGGEILWGHGGDDILTAGQNAAWLIGGGGNDILSNVTALDIYIDDFHYVGLGGYSGTLFGGSGDDVYIIHDKYAEGTIVVSELNKFAGGSDEHQREIFNSNSPATDSGGNDTVVSYIDYSLQSAEGIIENLILQAGVRVGSGNDFDNQIAGNDSDNIVSGFGGNDFIYGYSGSDQLSGGKGADIILGGNGNDFLDGGTEDDRLYGEDGNDTLAGGRGNDTIDGGSGRDTVVFLGHRGDYSFTKSGLGLEVTNTGLEAIDGTDLVMGVERFEFTGGLGAPAVTGAQTIVSTDLGETLHGTSSRDVFYFDTASGLGLGADIIKGFGPGDLILTTSRFYDGNEDGRITANSSDRFLLPDTVYDVASDTGSIKVFTTTGVVSSLKFVGEVAGDHGLVFQAYAALGDPTDFMLTA